MERSFFCEDFPNGSRICPTNGAQLSSLHNSSNRHTDAHSGRFNRHSYGQCQVVRLWNFTWRIDSTSPTSSNELVSNDIRTPENGGDIRRSEILSSIDITG